MVVKSPRCTSDIGYICKDEGLALFMVLKKHQFACSDMLNGTVDYQKMIHSLCLQGFISQKLSGPSTPAGDALPIAKFISLYWLQRRPPPWPPPYTLIYPVYSKTVVVVQTCMSEQN